MAHDQENGDIPSDYRPAADRGVTGRPAPGWYSDPHDPTRHRWWDGAHWAEDTLPSTLARSFEASVPAPAPTLRPATPREEPRRQRPGAGRIAIAVGTVAAALLGMVLVFSGLLEAIAGT